MTDSPRSFQVGIFLLAAILFVGFIVVIQQQTTPQATVPAISDGPTSTLPIPVDTSSTSTDPIPAATSTSPNTIPSTIFPAPASAPSPTPTPVPAPTPIGPTSYTSSQVASHRTASDCWTSVSGSVYNLTSWIAQHPGGEGPIIQLCGTDGTAAFNAQHGDDRRPQQMLAGFKIGLLTN